MPEKAFYKIGDACKALDIQPYVLRYWETEFPLLRPDKSKSGQRVYSQEDMGVIQRIKELLYDEGFTIAGAKKKLEAELADGRKLHLGTADIREAAAPAEETTEKTAEKPAPKPAAPAEAAAPEKPPKRAEAKKAAPEKKATATKPASKPTPKAAKAAPKAPAPKPAPKPAPAPTAKAKPKPKPAPKAAPKPRPEVDAEAQQRIKTLEKGVRSALKEARAILSLLETEPQAKAASKKG